MYQCFIDEDKDTCLDILILQVPYMVIIHKTCSNETISPWLRHVGRYSLLLIPIEVKRIILLEQLLIGGWISTIKEKSQFSYAYSDIQQYVKPVLSDLHVVKKGAWKRWWFPKGYPLLQAQPTNKRNQLVLNTIINHQISSQLCNTFPACSCA